MKMILVPEPHINDKPFVNRKKYVTEVYANWEELNRVVDLYPPKTVGILFPGDIFHGKMHSDSDVIFWFVEFMKLRSKVVGIWSAVGNHEITYDTMFWNLITEIPPWIQGRDRIRKTPKGRMSLIQVVDELVMDNMTIRFNHYGRPVGKGKGKGWVSINHGDFIRDTIIGLIDNDLSYLKYAGYKDIEEFTSYQYNFIGHMHMAYGRFELSDCTLPEDSEFYVPELIYLASDGRTDRTQVKNTFLERNIYVLDTIDLSCVEVPHTLWSEEESFTSVDFQSRKKDKTILKAKKLATAVFTDQDMTNYLLSNVAGNDLRTDILVDMLEQRPLRCLVEIEEELQKLTVN